MTDLYDDTAPAEGTASHLSHLMGLKARFGPRDAGQHRFATGAEDNMVILQRIELGSDEEGSVFSALVDYPSWLTEDFLDIAGVVHVEAIVDGQTQTEISYAGIMHAEDVDETGDTVRLEIAPMYSQATLLARWPSAKLPNIKGVISLHTMGGARRACLGLWVYLGVVSPQDGHKNIKQILFWADSMQHKRKLLDYWLRDPTIEKAIVFASTQIECDSLANDLVDAGCVATALHGALSPSMRNQRLSMLREGHIQILVATDVGARGIDMRSISHVFNYGLPMKAEDYIHRIGLTGRDGTAVTIAEFRDRRKISDIEFFIKQPIKSDVIPGLEPTTPELGQDARGQDNRSFEPRGDLRQDARGEQRPFQRPGNDKRSAKKPFSPAKNDA